MSGCDGGGSKDYLEAQSWIDYLLGKKNHQFVVKNVITGSLLELYIDLMIHTSWTGNIRVFQDLISLVGAL